MQSVFAIWVRGLAMEKWFCLGSLIASGLMLVIFILDLFVGIPFSSATPPGKSSPYVIVDIAGILAAGVLGYLGWNAYQDVK